MINAAVVTSSEDPVRAYLTEIGRYSLLGAAQEIEFAKAIEAGTEAQTRLERTNGSLSAATRETLQLRVGAGKHAQRTFIESNLRLVVSIARRYQGHGLPLLDLIQDGNIGLLRAVEKFDWRQGFKFSTYGTWWIRQAVTRGLADRSRTIRLPVHVAEVVNRLRAREAELCSALGRDPTDDEVASAMDIDVDKVQAYRRMGAEPVSLSSPLGVEGEADLNDVLADENGVVPLEEVVRSQSADELREILGTLSPREQRIIKLRFGLTSGEGQTLAQVSEEFNLTRERIRQIEVKAIAKLRDTSLIADLEGLRD